MGEGNIYTGGMMTAEDADTDEDGTLSESELSELTIAQIRQIAAELGYEITGTTKAELIASFLEAQTAAAEASAGGGGGGG